MQQQTDFIDEAKQLVKDLCHKDWMDDDDWAWVKEQLFEQTGTSYEKLAAAIKVGVENGYSVKQQRSLLAVLLRLSN